MGNCCICGKKNVKVVDIIGLFHCNECKDKIKKIGQTTGHISYGGHNDNRR